MTDETIDLNQLAKTVRAANENWWVDLDTGLPVQRNKGELLMLMCTELAEATEGERKGLMDDKLPHRPMAEVELADLVIRALDYAGGFTYKLPAVDGLEISPEANRAETLLKLTKMVTLIHDWELIQSVSGLAQENVPKAIARLIKSAERYCAVFGYDLWGAYEEKMDYNATRVDHTPEHRRAAGGKKW